MVSQGGLSYQPSEPTATRAVLSWGGQWVATGVTGAAGERRPQGGAQGVQELGPAGSQCPSPCLGSRVMNLSVYSLLGVETPGPRADRRTGTKCA